MASLLVASARTKRSRSVFIFHAEDGIRARNVTGVQTCALPISKGKKVGVVGLGGLGHMGVKFAHALGAHVVVFSTSPNKKEDALRLGADEVVISRNADEMQKHAGSFDFILDAVSANHDIGAYINLLRRD